MDCFLYPWAYSFPDAGFNFASRKKYPPKLYIQGDLHGSESWKRFFREYKKDRYPEKHFIFLGDVSDPEPPNWKMIPREDEDRYRMDGELRKFDEISRAMKSDPNTYFILGNHEAMRLAPLAKYLDPEFTFFTRKANDFRYYCDNAPEIAALWGLTADRIRKLIDDNRGKVFIAKTFGNVVLSHGGFSNMQLFKCASPDRPVSSSMAIKNLDDYFAQYKGYNKRPVAEMTLPGMIQIFGHYAGIREFPAIIQGPMGGKSYCIDDSIQNRGPDKRGFIYYVGDDVFEVFR